MSIVFVGNMGQASLRLEYWSNGILEEWRNGILEGWKRIVTSYELEGRMCCGSKK
jgi:hypothetical protein